MSSLAIEQRLTELLETPKAVVQRVVCDGRPQGPCVRGLEALLMCIQLSGPEQTVLGPETYDQDFSMHGITMIFWYAAPILSGFINLPTGSNRNWTGAPGSPRRQKMTGEAHEGLCNSTNKCGRERKSYSHHGSHFPSFFEAFISPCNCAVRILSRGRLGLARRGNPPARDDGGSRGGDTSDAFLEGRPRVLANEHPP